MNNTMIDFLMQQKKQGRFVKTYLAIVLTTIILLANSCHGYGANLFIALGKSFSKLFYYD